MTNMAPIVLSTVHVHPLLRHVTKSVGCVRVNLVTKEVTVLLISMNAVWESRVQLTPIASTLAGSYVCSCEDGYASANGVCVGRWHSHLKKH